MRLLLKQLIFVYCCSLSYEASATKIDNFLVISDIHLDMSSRHEMEIEPKKEDCINVLDRVTFEALLSQVKTNIEQGRVSKPNFIILQGDLAGYKRVSSHSVIDSEVEVAKKMKKIFPSIPIFYVFGNNDSLKQDHGPFIDLSRDAPKSPYEVLTTLGGWDDGFLSTGIYCKKKNINLPCIITENINVGYYSAYIKPRFRMVVLNTVLFTKATKYINKQESAQQLDWFKSQLTSAQKMRESVLIVMHVPPGNNIYNHSSFWFKQEQAIFLNIVKLYRSVISGILASHTHKEELKVIGEIPGNDILGIYFTAGFSTVHGNAPSVKTFYFEQKNDKTWKLTNYKTFHFFTQKLKTMFALLYDYRGNYCNSKHNELKQCLREVTAAKMKKYYTCGNPNYAGSMMSPEDINLK